MCVYTTWLGSGLKESFKLRDCLGARKSLVGRYICTSEITKNNNNNNYKDETHRQTVKETISNSNAHYAVGDLWPCWLKTPSLLFDWLQPWSGRARWPCSLLSSPSEALLWPKADPNTLQDHLHLKGEKIQSVCCFSWWTTKSICRRDMNTIFISRIIQYPKIWLNNLTF